GGQGVGRGGGSGASHDNHGVNVENGGQVTARGAGNVTVFGTGGSANWDSSLGGGSCIGVSVTTNATPSTITSSGGNVQITGTGGLGSGPNGSNTGVGGGY